MLQDMEASIQLYESHLDFYDELINDCRQITYDATKEITDLKNSMAFNEVRYTFYCVICVLCSVFSVLCFLFCTLCCSGRLCWVLCYSSSSSLSNELCKQSS
jgi:hypothetical protein